MKADIDEKLVKRLIQRLKTSNEVISFFAEKIITKETHPEKNQSLQETMNENLKLIDEINN